MRSKALVVGHFTRGERQVPASSIVALNARQPAAAQVGMIHTYESRSGSIMGLCSVQSRTCTVADLAVILVAVPTKSHSILTSIDLWRLTSADKADTFQVATLHTVDQKLMYEIRQLQLQSELAFCQHL